MNSTKVEFIRIIRKIHGERVINIPSEIKGFHKGDWVKLSINESTIIISKLADSERMAIKQRQKRVIPSIHEVPIKPWEDPESMFCDTEFLKGFLGKEPRKGTECIDKPLRGG